MTYNAGLSSSENRASSIDTTITSQLGIDVSAYAQLDSSVITFTPTASATDIIYRFTFYINPYQASGPAGRSCRTHFKLQSKTTGGAWSDESGCESNEIFEAASGPMCQRHMTLRYRIASSTGERDYRIVAKSFSSSYRSALHWTHFWSGSAVTSGDVTGQKNFNPVVECYER
tara:strand:+ start:156 stop:674 length:519 start_codon:yes stop_codon:yes gene_type:complete